jgi:DedD protein
VPRLPLWSEVLKTRLLGAAVLIALAVLFLPMIFTGKSPAPAGDQSVSLAIPPAPDRDLQTKTMSLNPNAAVSTPNAAAPAIASSAPQATASAVTKGAGDLATVNIGSNRPRDVETDPNAGNPPVPTTVTTRTVTSPSQPLIPMQTKPAASATTSRSQPAAPPAIAESPTTSPEATAAVGRGNYTLNLSAYASAAGAASLEHRVRALGYPVSRHAITQAGQTRTLVIAGPFETRTAAEAARLKITQSIPGAPARLEQDASHDDEGTAAAAASPAPHAAGRVGGWAVQLAAMSNQADANALRDKLRANGFDGFVDTVQSNGKQLWRVRAGPQTQRADALHLRDQIKAKLGTDGNIVPVP